MKVYLAGPMRGIADGNFPAFHAAAARLRAQGHEVFNPAENDEEMIARGEKITIRSCLRIDMDWLCSQAEAIALLPGWRNSKGASAEHATALAIDLKVIELEDWARDEAMADIAAEVAVEAARAAALWPPFNSAHEGFGVLLEEVDELKDHVWTNQKRRDLGAMRKEAIQVAAMAIRMVFDVIDGGRGRK